MKEWKTTETEGGTKVYLLARVIKSIAKTEKACGRTNNLCF